MLPVAVFLVAALARLWQIDLVRFADDQATLLGSAAHFVASRQMPLTTGMSFTIGIRHPPLATFLLTPPELVSHSPVVAAAYVAIMDAFGAVFLYWTGKSLGGPTAGLVAGLLYALQPAAVVYGRTIWNPDFVPLCAAVALWGLVELWQRDRLWAQATALFAIGCAAQLHPQAAALLVVWLATAIAKRRAGWPSGVAVLALGLVLAPYLYLQATSGWSDVRAAWQYLQQPKVLDAQAFVAVGDLFSSRPYSELLASRGSTPPVSLADPLLWFYAVGLLTGLALVFGRRRGAEVIVAGCFVAPLLAALDHSGDVAAHYLLVLLPSGCLLVALTLLSLGAQGGIRGPLMGTDAALDAQHHKWGWLGSAVFAAGLALSGVRYVQFQRAVPEAVGANYGMPLRYSLQAAQLARTSRPPLHISNPDAEAGVFAYLLGNQKRFDGRYTFVLPHGPATYVADASLGFAYGRLSQLGPPSALVTTPGGRVAYGVFSVSGSGSGTQGMQPLDVDVGHSIRLIGYDARDLRAGAASTVHLAWQVTDAHGPIPDDLRQFAHLVDASGALWSTNPDFRGYPRPYWQAGDVVVSAFDLNLPSSMPTGGYWLETGFYEPISGERVPQYHGGQPAGTAARIGPLKVAGVSPSSGDARPLAVFGDGEIALLDAQRTGAGVTLRWQALKKPARDYTVFIHVLDAHGGLVAQQDSPPRGGAYPTSLWDAGEVVDDPHPLSFSAQPGQRLEIGLYTFPDLHRLPLDGSNTDRVLVPTS